MSILKKIVKKKYFLFHEIFLFTKVKDVDIKQEAKSVKY